MSTQPTIYSIEINDAQGNPVDLEQYKGKKLIIVNVASKCGYTPQYDDLQKFYEANKDKVQIIGVPCNDFGGQEPGTEEEIVSFCRVNYGVTFPIMEKVSIKGENPHPLYQWLTQKSENGVSDNDVKWNFHKFLINEDGTLYKEMPSGVKPQDEEIASWVNK